MQALREALAEWQAANGAMDRLAVAIGLLDDSTPWGGRKDIFWSNNLVGTLLFDPLRQLAEMGMLEFDDEEQRFRWSQAFTPTS